MDVEQPSVGQHVVKLVTQDTYGFASELAIPLSIKPFPKRPLLR